MKIEESLNVTFDETPPPSKTSPLVYDDLDEEEAVTPQIGSQRNKGPGRPQDFPRDNATDADITK
ncbi:hypothetical protein Tco_0224987, partial [Tanacetum coccineum]